MARRRPSPTWPPPPAEVPRCALCGRPTPALTEHHLIPKSQGRRRGTKRAEWPTVLLCSPCHKHLHATFSNAELAGEYATIDALLEHEGVQRFVRWLQKQAPSKGVRVKSISAGR